MSLRAVRRAVALAWALTLCLVHLGLMRLRGPLTLQRRALWLQAACRRVLISFGIRSRAEGRPPTHGLVVSNHLSYLDILIFSSVMPCFFISKTEVKSWPYFGMAARAGGTLFIDRSSRASAAAVASEMVERLKLPIPVLLFAEGTSSNGAQVLRFHSTLFEPAAAAGAPVTAAAVRYVIEGGGEESDLCWFGDTLFLPHLWKVLGTAGFSAVVQFGAPHVYADRRSAAAATHAEVTAIRNHGDLVARGRIGNFSLRRAAGSSR